MITLNCYVSFLVVFLVVLFPLAKKFSRLLGTKWYFNLHLRPHFASCTPIYLSPCVLNSILCRCQSCLLTPFRSVDAEATGLTCMQLFYCSIGEFNIPSSLLFTLGNNQYPMHSYITYIYCWMML